MDQILQMILEIVREQQRDATDLRDTMTKAEVVELTMSMMEQQGVDEYHEDLEADIYHRIQYLAPRLFEHEDVPQKPEIHTEKFSYRMTPTEEALLNNENLTLDHMVGDKLQKLDSPITIDTTTLDYEQIYTSENPIPFPEPTHFSVESSKHSNPLENIDSTTNPESTGISEPIDLSESISEQISSINPQPNEAFQDVFGEDVLNQASIDEEALNQLVMAKYMELANSHSNNPQIDSESLASLVMQALQGTPTETEIYAEDIKEDAQDNKVSEDEDQVDSLLKEIWESEANTDTFSSHNTLSGFYNTKTYMEEFSNYLKNIQENQPILTGFSSIDRILETGLHKGLYLINSDCIDMSSFCLQLADQMAMKGKPVCYFLFHHSRYECMAKSLSRLTYELRGKEKAYTLSALYQKQEKENLNSIQTELKYYEEKIAANLYFVETNCREDTALLSDIEHAVKTLEQTIGQKPVILLDDLSVCKGVENLISKLEYLCSDLEIILITSTNQRLNDMDDNKYSSIQIELTELPEQNSFTKREIILETGDSLLLDISFIDGSSRQQKKCQLFSTPKFYCFEARE